MYSQLEGSTSTGRWGFIPLQNEHGKICIKLLGKRSSVVIPRESLYFVVVEGEGGGGGWEQMMGAEEEEMRLAYPSWLQGFLWLAEKTIEQTTEQWTLAPRTIEVRDTQIQWN